RLLALLHLHPSMASLPFRLPPRSFSISKSETLGISLRASSTGSLAISTTSCPSSIPAGMYLKRRKESGSSTRSEMYVSHLLSSFSSILFLTVSFSFVFDVFSFVFCFDFFSEGNDQARPRDKTKGRGTPRVPIPPSPLRKVKFDDDEKIKIEIDESLFSR
ncbi:30S ribosomal protein S31, chloroplastic, partial [Cucurbita argyrosperma subsp. argyrosperma]